MCIIGNPHLVNAAPTPSLRDLASDLERQAAAARAARVDFEQANLGAYGASAARAGASFGSAAGVFGKQLSEKTFTRSEVLAVLRAQRAITLSSHISDLITIFERME